MFKTLKNAWKISELRSKLLFTMLIIVLYRLGANIPVPYVNAELVSGMTEQMSGTILGFLNILSGQALGQATLFALGVSPYITSSIVVQLLTVALPPLERWAKDGENGKKKLTMLTRLVTIALALITSVGYLFYLDAGFNGQSYLVDELNWFNGIVIVACYCAGAALVMWLAEKINEHGIGNGISIILFANIVAGTWTVLQLFWGTIFTMDGFSGFDWVGLIVVLAQIIIFTGMIFLIVWMSDAERRIPIQYAKRVVGRKMYGGQNTNLPLKVNMAGVMPIIFANSIVAIPATITSFMRSENWATKLVENWFNYNTWPYLIVFLGLLIAFAFFYVAISFNPVEVANNIKNNGGAIPGIRSGRPTVEYIKRILNRITLVGALIIAFIACFPMIINIVDTMITPGSVRFQALTFGGSSLIIVVGVALETVRELEAQMSLRNYKGFLD